MSTFKPGDLVTVAAGCNIEALGTVASVGKLKVVLEDGSAWRAGNGRKWGSDTDGFLARRLRGRQPCDVDVWRRQTAIDAFRRIMPADLPLDLLEQIVNLARDGGAR
jgi:hypothetical protein